MKRAALLAILVAGCAPNGIALDGGADLALIGDPDLAIDLSQACPEATPTLADLRAAFAGSWTGNVTTPWTPLYTVAATFSADGHYSAHSLSAGDVAFYYGTDEDDAAKTYLIDDQLANGDGVGEIEIVFFHGTPPNRGSLQHVRSCDGGRRLDFEFWADWSGGNYGPVAFRLGRY